MVYVRGWTMSRKSALFALNDRWLYIIYMSDLRRLRKHLGMTQEQLAEALDVTRSTISAHERGVAPVPRERMLAVLALCMWAVLAPERPWKRRPFA